MFDRVNVDPHAHASAVNPDGPKCTTTSETDTTKQRSEESTSKSPESKRNDDLFMERCIGKIRETSRTLMESL
jgi:hypothetical protein